MRKTATEAPIEDYLCLALYTASRAVTGLYRELLDELDLTYPQYLVMRVLWQPGAVPVKDIGATLALDYGTLSPLLKRLEARGLIRRVCRSEDECCNARAAALIRTLALLAVLQNAATS